MKNAISILIYWLLLTACTSNRTDKQKELLEKETELLKRENALLKKEKAVARQTSESGQSTDSLNSAEQKPDAEQTVNWPGTWTFEDDGPVTYTLTIKDKYRGMNLCTYSVKGIQTFYTLECQGYDKGNSFELYYRSTQDGVFRMADKIDINKPAITLIRKGGKVLTYWNQFINNYVEQGNHSGQVCFRKDR